MHAGGGQPLMARIALNLRGARARGPGPLSFGCFSAGVRVAPCCSHRPRSALQDASRSAPRGSRQPASMTRDVAESGSKVVRIVIFIKI